MKNAPNSRINLDKAIRRFGGGFFRFFSFFFQIHVRQVRADAPLNGRLAFQDALLDGGRETTLGVSEVAAHHGDHRFGEGDFLVSAVFGDGINSFPRQPFICAIHI